MQKVSETSLAMKLNTSDVCNTLFRKASSNLREFALSFVSSRCEIQESS